ncbi:hypothetical protein KAU11_02715 [Candidatus Babeliales bacterium]|nr:hypothetical protein [Candidatus Babeliales bacterium]
MNHYFKKLIIITFFLSQTLYSLIYKTESFYQPQSGKKALVLWDVHTDYAFGMCPQLTYKQANCFENFAQNNPQIQITVETPVTTHCILKTLSKDLEIQCPPLNPNLITLLSSSKKVNINPCDDLRSLLAPAKLLEVAASIGKNPSLDAKLIPYLNKSTFFSNNHLDWLLGKYNQKIKQFFKFGYSKLGPVLAEIADLVKKDLNDIKSAINNAEGSKPLSKTIKEAVFGKLLTLGMLKALNQLSGCANGPELDALEKILNYKNQLTVIIVGAYHASILAKMLIAAEFTTIRTYEKSPIQVITSASTAAQRCGFDKNDIAFENLFVTESELRENLNNFATDFSLCQIL